MEDRRKKILIYLSLFVGILLAILLFAWFYFGKTKQANEAQNMPVSESASETGDKATEMTVSDNIIKNVVPKTKEPPAELYPEQLAKTFVERLFSYSNQNDNQHLKDVEVMATADMLKWVNKQKIAFSNEYQGVNTKVISSSVSEIKEKVATVAIGVQQIYEGKENKVVYKTGRVELMKVNDVWKVDGIYWDK